VIVAEALLNDFDVAAVLEKNGEGFAKKVTDFLAWCELLVIGHTEDIRPDL
jgi:hypothetical protein